MEKKLKSEKDLLINVYDNYGCIMKTIKFFYQSHDLLEGESPLDYLQRGELNKLLDIFNVS